MKSFILVFTMSVFFGFSAHAAQPCSQAQTKVMCDKFLAGCDLGQPHSCGCEIHSGYPLLQGGSHCTLPDGSLKRPGVIQPAKPKR
jgi:hypothetical protein